MPRSAAQRALTISAGHLKGATLYVPASDKLRPTLAQVRLAICNIWQTLIPGATLIDGFAGSGALGIEVWSRGASQVIAIEADRRTGKHLEAEVTRIGKERDCLPDLQLGWHLRAGRVEDVILKLVEEGIHADLMVIDPPYGYDGLKALIRLIFDIGILREGGELLVECAPRDLNRLPPTGDLHGAERIREYRYGGTVLVRYQAGTSGGGE
ncbi:MAG: RsmD family RNA methyltransferase [bacterium]